MDISGRQEQDKKYWSENQMVVLVYSCLLTGLLLEFPPSTWEKQEKSRAALSWTIYQVNTGDKATGQVGAKNRLVNILNYRQMTMLDATEKDNLLKGSEVIQVLS